METGPESGLLPEWEEHPLQYVPAVFHGATSEGPDPCELPLRDIIAANVDHFRLDADYKHALHLAAFPTAWVTGFDKSQALRVGSATAWVSEIPGASAGFLEFSGAGIGHLERAIEKAEKRMALLSDELITPQAPAGAQLTALGGGSGLVGIVASVSASLTAVLRMAAEQVGVAEEPSIALNTDIDATPLRGEDISALVGAWKAGAISRETLLERPSRGEVLPSGRSAWERSPEGRWT